MKESIVSTVSASNTPVVHLNRYYHFTEWMRDPEVEGTILRYRSFYDDSLQSLLVLEPGGVKSEKLFFFFHGMDGDIGDGVVVRQLVSALKAKVICPGGRGPAWISDAFLADSEQVIRQYSRGSRGYYLAGISMGGTQALSLAGLLPDSLRQSLLGVMTFMPASDLAEVIRRSSHERVRKTLMASMNGSTSEMKDRSPVSLTDRYRKSLPFVIGYNEKDTLLLSDELDKFITALRQRNFPVVTFSIPGNHEFTYTHLDYKSIFDELGKNDSRKRPLPLLSR